MFFPSGYINAGSDFLFLKSRLLPKYILFNKAILCIIKILMLTRVDCLHTLIFTNSWSRLSSIYLLRPENCCRIPSHFHYFNLHICYGCTVHCMIKVKLHKNCSLKHPPPQKFNFITKYIPVHYKPLTLY